MKATNLLLLTFLLFLSCGSNLADEQLKWNFKEFKKLTYKYSQIVESQPALGSAFGMDEKTFGMKKISNEYTGKLTVSVKENGKADMAFTNVRMSMVLILSEGDTNRMMGQIFPDFFIEDMDEFGKIDGVLNQQTELIGRILFPLPPKKIAVSESVDLPVTMPFNMFGSQINVKGFNTVKLESISQNIASLSTIVDVSECTDTNYNCYLKGTSEYKFNMAKGCFSKANIHVEMSSAIVSKRDLSDGEKDSAIKITDKGFGMKMATTIKLDLMETE